MKGKSLIWCIAGILALSLCVAGSVWVLYSDIPVDMQQTAPQTALQTDQPQTAQQTAQSQTAPQAPQTDRPSAPDRPAAKKAAKKTSDGNFSAVVKMLGRNYHMTQGSDNVLHASDKDGKEFWSLRLGAPIDNAVCVVDFYSNGKEQFLFISGGKLYLVDRLGRVVEDFPKKATEINN